MPRDYWQPKRLREERSEARAPRRSTGCSDCGKHPVTHAMKVEIAPGYTLGIFCTPCSQSYYAADLRPVTQADIDATNE